MLGRIKVLEDYVHDLYSMCNDEFDIKMTSQCYDCCQNLLKYIDKLKNYVYFNTGDKTSNMYKKLSNLEYDLITLMNTMKSVEVMGLNKHRVPSVGSCLICQKRTEPPDNAGNSIPYLPSKDWYVNSRCNGFGDLGDFYERLPSASIENIPIIRNVHHYRYPSITVKSVSPPSLSSISTSNVLVEEYYEAPKKKSNKYRIVREGLPFSVRKTRKSPVIRVRRKPKHRPRLTEERRSTPPTHRPPQIKEKRRSPPSKRRRPHSMPQSRKKYDHRDFERSYDYSSNPKRMKEKIKYRDTMEREKRTQEIQPSDYYFVKRTKGPLLSRTSNNEKKSPTNYIVSRLKRIPNSNNFNEEKSRATSVHFNDRDRKYGQLDGQKRRQSGKNSSESSLERKISRDKRRKSPLHSQSSIFSNWSNTNNNNPLKIQRFKVDSEDSRRQHIQNNKDGLHKLYDYNFETNYPNFNDRLPGSTNKKIKRSYDDSEGRRGQQHIQTKKQGTRKLHEYNLGAKKLRSVIYSSSSSCSSCYELIDLFIGPSKGLNSPVPCSLGKTSSLPKEPQLRGLKKVLKNQMSIYQIHGKIGSNPFMTNGTNKTIPSTIAVMSPLKKSASFSKHRKSLDQPSYTEAIIHNTDYSDVEDSGVKKEDSILLEKKSSTADVVVRKSNPRLSNVKKSNTKFSKVGSKIRNIVRSVSSMKHEKQPSKNLVIDKSESLSLLKQSAPNVKIETIDKRPSYNKISKQKNSLIGQNRQSSKRLARPLKMSLRPTKNSVIDRSDSLSSFKQSDPYAKVENIHKQNSFKNSIKPKNGLVGNGQQNSGISARPLKMSYIDETNNNGFLVSSIDNNKTNGKGLTYSFNYKREKRQEFKCDQWPTITYSLNQFGSNCETLLSEESIDISEHKLNGMTIRKKYRSNSPPLSIEESNNNGKPVMKTAKAKHFRPNSFHDCTKNILTTKSSPVPQLHSEEASWCFDWKQIVKEMKDF